MTTELPGWLMDEEEADAPTPPSNRRWLLVGLAALPWVTVVGLLLTGHLAVPASTGDDAPAHEPESEVTAPAPGDGSAAIPPAPQDPRAPSEGAAARTEAVDGAASAPAASAQAGSLIGAMAVAVARAWLTDVGPQVRIDGLTPRADRYLEQAVLETVDRRGGIAVATLLAVVLERDGELYTDAAVHRLAVPLSVDASGVRPAGEPWWLPDPDLRSHAPRLEAVDDPEAGLSLAEHLTAAGYEDVEIEAVSRHAGGWLVADTVAGLPDGRSVEAPVWLAPPEPTDPPHRREDAPVDPAGPQSPRHPEHETAPHAEEQP